MSQPQPLEAVFKLERSLGASWPSIRAAHDATVMLHERLGQALDQFTSEDTSVVIFGSAARFEVTSQSDTDWLYLVDGQADPRHRDSAIGVTREIEKIGNEPGPEGTFGTLASSHDLVQFIGGRDDTNANLTRRILLLLESRPIGRREAYDRVVRAVLDRYLSGDHGWISGHAPYGIPRFLQNDIARYWRTVAVDFAYKQWTRNNEGWALRSAKLRMSRKLTYAAGLLYCFHLATAERNAPLPSRESLHKHQGIDALSDLTHRTPLDILAQAFLSSESLHEYAKRAFDAYDRFLGLLNLEEDRTHLKTLRPEDADGDRRYQLVRNIGEEFQAGLTHLFLENTATQYPALIKAYGVF
jgi:predicted nucleotidyltransferase